MTLTNLSLSRFRQVNGVKQKHPHVPTNIERLQSLRSVLVPETGNQYPWPHLRMEAK